MEPRYLHNGESGVRYMLGKVKKEIGEPNLGYLLAYEKSMHISGSNPRTITRHLRELRRVLGVLGDKDAKKATQ
ncbi:MAG: hypothetical protein KGH57_03945, partial [Candidatus Micrarchaeota archaeon]|nr:hypothetical protein [Candidatus Micrarchaeota archaeon]